MTLTSETAGSEITNPDGIGPVDPAAAQVARATRGVGTVLVTGAASGLGRAVAAAVTAAGGRALLVDRVAVERRLPRARSPPSPTCPTPRPPKTPSAP